MKLTDDKHCFIPEEDQCGWRWGKGYELDDFEFTMEQIYKRNTALDIGAHVGIWSKRLASEFSDVVSFEPIPQHIECWIRNVKNDNVVLNKVAISDKIGTATMKYINYFTGLSTLHYNAEDIDYQFKILTKKYFNKFKRLTKEKILQKPEDVIVETKTIDSYNFHNVDFIKMDVEGHELEALKGAENTIRKYMPPIYIEISNKDAYIFLTELGYRQKEDFGYDHYLFKCVI